MRFYTVEIDGRQEAAVSVGTDAESRRRIYPVRRLNPALGLCDVEDMNQLIRRMTPQLQRQLTELTERFPESPAVFLEDVKLCAPIVRPEQDILCLGINYREHAEEAGRFSEEAFGGERPRTIYFSKRVNRAVASGETIPSYSGLVDSLDYEAELGVIIGRDVKDAGAQEAKECIFGYTIVNDISARNLQTQHKQWYRGKSLDGFAPMGPCIVTPEEIGDAENLEISCTVNGEVRQHSSTRYMIQNVVDTIVELSRGMTLRAGTIIATGTPAGVGMGMNPPRFLKPGDVVVCEIERIGRLSNVVE